MSSAPRSADLSPRAYPSVSLQRRKSTGIQYKSKRPAPGAAAPAPAAPAVPAVDDDEETCPVCTMPMELPFKTKCKHQFCYLCLKSVITRSNSYHGPTCPLCRAALDPAQLKTAEIEANLARYPMAREVLIQIHAPIPFSHHCIIASVPSLCSTWTTSSRGTATTCGSTRAATGSGCTKTPQSRHWYVTRAVRVVWGSPVLVTRRSWSDECSGACGGAVCVRGRDIAGYGYVLCGSHLLSCRVDCSAVACHPV